MLLEDSGNTGIGKICIENNHLLYYMHRSRPNIMELCRIGRKMEDEGIEANTYI